MKGLLFVLLLFCAISASAGEIWVAPEGNDAYPGTRDKPKATLQSALREAREWRRLGASQLKGGITILLRSGTYYLRETVFIRPEDAGTPDCPTVIRAATAEQPILSGGISITQWKKNRYHIPGLPKGVGNKLWVADAPVIAGNTLNFRQLWVNGEKAIRATDRTGSNLQRILSWDHQTGTCVIPASGLPDLEGREGLEMMIHQWWAIAQLRVRKFERIGDSARLSFYEPENRVQNEHPWPAPWISAETGNSAFRLLNAIQLLDEPGEWYLDRRAGKLYFYPPEGVNMEDAHAVVPYLEQLVKMEGVPGRPVSYVHFEGITFQHSTWLRPSENGHVPLQAGMYLLDAYKLNEPGTKEKPTLENQAWVGRPPAAVQLEYVAHTSFNKCSFEHTASAAIDYTSATLNDTISGCAFYDIGGNAIQAGIFSDEAFEAHLPYDPADEAVLCRNLSISNNYIRNAGSEDWGCTGIAAGFVRGINIAFNELCDLPYTGISLGWGWTPTLNAMRNNSISGNYIHHYAKYMYDVAGIYTLSAQPGSVISNNRIDSIYRAPFPHIPSHWFYLYTDEGSAYMRVENNWTPSAKFLQNANGPGNTWKNNGPEVHDSIRRMAGIQPAFKMIADRFPPLKPVFPINKEHPVVIELVEDKRKFIDQVQLKDVLNKQGVNAEHLYQWKNHLVAFGNVKDVFLLQGALKEAFPQAGIKIYDAPFYEFNRTQCGDDQQESNWTHTILTTNLVEDGKLQQEYMDHHETQFIKWPEVSKGFCNASFQRLLLFRNGRQLMLVISIPAGKSLEELNPKTVENNPRVEQWNRLMSKYQTGIAGTAPNEVWVELKKEPLKR